MHVRDVDRHSGGRQASDNWLKPILHPAGRTGDQGDLRARVGGVGTFLNEPVERDVVIRVPPNGSSCRWRAHSEPR